MKKEIMIETERLRLRPIEDRDAKDIYEYSRETNVGPNAGWKPHETIKETHEIMKLIFLDNEGVFGIVLRSCFELQKYDIIH